MPKNFKRPIQSIKIKTFFLSIGRGMDLELLNLNILIGPNGSGKSDFIDALRFWQTLSNSGKSFAHFFQNKVGSKIGSIAKKKILQNKYILKSSHQKPQIDQATFHSNTNFVLALVKKRKEQSLN